MNNRPVDEEIIRRVPLFANLPDKEVARLAASVKRTGWDAGSVLFREGEQGSTFYIVFRGRVAIIQGMGTPDERIIDVRGPGEFIGEASLFSPHGLRSASARAEENCLLLEMTRYQLDGLLRRDPTLTYQMLRVQSERLRAANDAAMQELRQHNQQLAQAYAELREAQSRIIEQEALARELQLAHQIQTRMLPSDLPALPCYDIGARSTPARMVGGDFYDVFRLDGERVGIAIGDVSGKGIPAALLMSLTCALLRVEAHRSASPEEAVSNVNRYLMERNSEEFVTLLYGVLYARSGLFSYARAGHELPLISTDHEVSPAPMGRSLPLGISEDLPLDAQTVALPPDGTLLLYTDGVTEAFHGEHGLFGEPRLREMLVSRSHDSSQDLCNGIVDAVMAFSGDTALLDDLTVVAVRKVCEQSTGKRP
jgi:serine phosphatase RsbU (regulator of sigma subunit)